MINQLFDENDGISEEESNRRDCLTHLLLTLTVCDNVCGEDVIDELIYHILQCRELVNLDQSKKH